MPLNTLTWQKCVASLAPSGTIEITSNGEHDVMGYAVANVNVAGGGGIPAPQSFTTVNFGDTNTQTDTYAIAHLYYDNTFISENQCTYSISPVGWKLRVYGAENDIEMAEYTVNGGQDYVRLDVLYDESIEWHYVEVTIEETEYNMLIMLTFSE